MMRHKVAPAYSQDFLEVERPQPLSDLRIENEIQQILHGHWSNDISDTIYDDLKSEMELWLLNSNLNNLLGLDTFDRKDIINGCTQFIDNLYMQGPVQVLKEDYRYHQRLGYANFVDVGSLLPNVPLIIAMPFPQIGAPHPNMKELLDEATSKHIDVHIDGAWISCCRDVHFELHHPAIRSVGISLSKGLGLGWNRIGLRWTRQPITDSVTIMNDFRMNIRVAAKIGLHFIRQFESDYLWSTYGDIYYKVCRDFDLTPTKAIYLALRNGQPVGISPLIRHVAEK